MLCPCKRQHRQHHDRIGLTLATRAGRTASNPDQDKTGPGRARASRRHAGQPDRRAGQAGDLAQGSRRDHEGHAQHSQHGGEASAGGRRQDGGAHSR